MTDTEMLILCRDAMGYAIGAALFNPLRDDSHAMAMVKKFGLWISREDDGSRAVWLVTTDRVDGKYVSAVHPTDLNRAIVECVATMQQDSSTKHTPKTY